MVRPSLVSAMRAPSTQSRTPFASAASVPPVQGTISEAQVGRASFATGATRPGGSEARFFVVISCFPGAMLFVIKLGCSSFCYRPSARWLRIWLFDWSTPGLLLLRMQDQLLHPPVQ
jgi:hypothetical protein